MAYTGRHTYMLQVRDKDGKWRDLFANPGRLDGMKSRGAEMDEKHRRQILLHGGKAEDRQHLRIQDQKYPDKIWMIFPSPFKASHPKLQTQNAHPDG